MYSTKIFMGVYPNGKVDQEVYGDINQTLSAMEHLICEICKMVYYSTEESEDARSQNAIDTMQTMYQSGMIKAMNDIVSGKGENAYYEY